MAIIYDQATVYALNNGVSLSLFVQFVEDYSKVICVVPVFSLNAVIMRCAYLQTNTVFNYHQ